MLVTVKDIYETLLRRCYEYPEFIKEFKDYIDKNNIDLLADSDQVSIPYKFVDVPFRKKIEPNWDFREWWKHATPKTKEELENCY